MTNIQSDLPKLPSIMTGLTVIAGRFPGWPVESPVIRGLHAKLLITSNYWLKATETKQCHPRQQRKKLKKPKTTLRRRKILISDAGQQQDFGVSPISLRAFKSLRVEMKDVFCAKKRSAG